MVSITVNGNNIQVEGTNILIRNGTISVNGNVVEKNASGIVKIDLNGTLASLNTDCSVNCEKVEGNVNAGGSVNCGDVGGNVCAGGSIHCDESQLSENEKEDIVIQAMKLITELKKANEFWKAEKIELRKIKKH